MDSNEMTAEQKVKARWTPVHIIPPGEANGNTWRLWNRDAGVVGRGSTREGAINDAASRIESKGEADASETECWESSGVDTICGLTKGHSGDHSDGTVHFNDQGRVTSRLNDHGDWVPVPASAAPAESKPQTESADAWEPLRPLLKEVINQAKKASAQ